MEHALFFLMPFFLAWGSFLNMLAYRLICYERFFAWRSFCPHCKKSLFWYDTIPLFSWMLLQGKCRFCSQSISVLYPFIELLTLGTMWCLILYITPYYWLAYFIFFSALIISIRTDLQFMLISRFASLYLIPLGWLCAACNLLPITFWDSVGASCLAYACLFVIAKIFMLCYKAEGMGQGDLELLAFIGSFLGIIGCWTTVIIGSLTGSLVGLGYCIYTKQYRQVKIPFGPFLALGALCSSFMCYKLTSYISTHTL